MSDGWQANVVSARKQGKSLYFVNDRSGGCMEATTSRETALNYVREQARPGLYVVYEQVGGYLYEVPV